MLCVDIFLFCKSKIFSSLLSRLDNIISAVISCLGFPRRTTDVDCPNGIVPQPLVFSFNYYTEQTMKALNVDPFFIETPFGKKEKRFYFWKLHLEHDF